MKQVLVLSRLTSEGNRGSARQLPVQCASGCSHPADVLDHILGEGGDVLIISMTIEYRIKLIGLFLGSATYYL